MSIFSSGRPSRIKLSKYLRSRDSNSPTLSTQSQKSLWTRSYKNQPIPAQLRTRLIGKKYQLADNSDDDDQQIMAVKQQQDQQVQQKKRLPILKVISDKGEFQHGKRNRGKNQRNIIYQRQRCHSVCSLKLPQVLQQKRQDDQLKRMNLSRLVEFKDKNQFDEKRKRKSSCDQTQIISKIQSMDAPVTKPLDLIIPEQILQVQVQQTKSKKAINQKSMITVQLDKIVVDEVDERKKKKQDNQFSEIQSIIQQQKSQLQGDKVDTGRLSQLIFRFAEESSYLNRINDEQDFSKKSEQNKFRMQEISQAKDNQQNIPSSLPKIQQDTLLQQEEVVVKNMQEPQKQQSFQQQNTC